MEIGITFDLKSSEPLPADAPDDLHEEFDSLQTIQSLARTIESLGHRVVLLGDGPDMVARLMASRPDFVFNYAEGVGISRSREARVPALLELLDIPYTGADPWTMAVTLDKDAAKKLVASAGVPVPASYLLHPGETLLDRSPTALSFPVVVKPAWEGSSKGIRSKCLVKNADELPDVIAAITADHQQPILIEEFIQGLEVTVALMGNDPPRVHGSMSIEPVEAVEHFVYSLEVKRDYRRMVHYQCPPELPPAVLERLHQAALTSFQVLGCRDVARIDFRVRDGVPYFLEVNPLPGLNPDDSDLCIMSRLMNIEFKQVVESILDAAFRRCKITRQQPVAGARR